MRIRRKVTNGTKALERMSSDVRAFDRPPLCAFYTPAGFGTEIAEGKEIRTFQSKKYILEEAYQADFALIKAWKGDHAGNLIFRGTAKNFNSIMTGAAKTTVVEVEKLVPVGMLDPNEIHTPGIFVDRIFQGESFEKRIENLTNSSPQ